MALLPLRRRWLRGPQRGAYRREDHDRARTWRAIWANTAEGVGLSVDVAVAAGTTAVVPPLLGIIDQPDQPVVLVVEMLRGQISDDYRAVAVRLAVALDAAMVAVVPRGGRTLGLVLHDTDPVAEEFAPPLPLVPSITHPIVLGRGEDGAILRHALNAAVHIAIQGQNGAGKSYLSYAVLGQVSHAHDVLITGSDITGLLLGTPWDGTRHRRWQAAGTADLAEHAATLEDLVAEMDRRLATMPRGVDKIAPTTDVPLVLVVLEELPGLLRAAGAQPKPTERGARTILERIKAAVLRLLSEGRKAAFRVLGLAQRFEAEAVGGGYAREQFALAMSLRVPADSLVMLHGDDARELGARHRTTDPGVAVVSAPGQPLTRMRTPTVGSYAEYCATVGLNPQGRP